jgi:hypothetical protein
VTERTPEELRRHADLQARVWNDERRMPAGTREVALALAWVLHMEPGARQWKRVRELLGYDMLGWRVHDLVTGDAPRYERGHWADGPGECEGPRVRPYRPRRVPAEDRCYVSGHHPHLGECRFPEVYGGEAAPPDRDDRVCGAHATIRVKEHDMVTGWVTVHWFCTRHRERAAAVKAQLAARGEPPAPVPNTGGLLPRYFAGDWAKIYARHCAQARSTGFLWQPSPYGCDADDWPAPGKTAVPKRPRLSLVLP